MQLEHIISEGSRVIWCFGSDFQTPSPGRPNKGWSGPNLLSCSALFHAPPLLIHSHLKALSAASLMFRPTATEPTKTLRLTLSMFCLMFISYLPGFWTITCVQLPRWSEEALPDYIWVPSANRSTLCHEQRVFLYTRSTDGMYLQIPLLKITVIMKALVWLGCSVYHYSKRVVIKELNRTVKCFIQIWCFGFISCLFIYL